MKKVLFILIAIIAISCQQTNSIDSFTGYYKVQGRCNYSFPGAGVEINKISEDRFTMKNLYDSTLTCIVTSPTEFRIPYQRYEDGYIEGTGTVLHADTFHVVYQQENFGMPDECDITLIRN
jgi:hypothetical protein